MQENVVKVSEIINNRYDAYYYRKEFYELKEKLLNAEHKTIGQEFDVTKLAGFEYTKYFTPENMMSNDSYIALTSRNIQTECLDLTNYITIDKTVADTFLTRSKLRKNDVVMSYTGEYRRALLLDKDGFQLGPNICLLRVKEEELSSNKPQFLSNYLNSTVGQKLLDREKTFSGQPTVAMSRIRELIIPTNPNIMRSVNILMKNAYKQKKDKELQAKNLLASIDDFVLDALNIKLPQLKKEKAYTTQISNILGSRFDPDYNQEYFSYIYNSLTKHNYDILKNLLVYYKKGAEVGTSRYIEQGMPFIRVSDFNSYGLTYSNNTKFISVDYFNELKDFSPQIGDILFSKDGTIGNSLLIDENIEGIISGGIIRLHPNRDKVNPQYLSTMLSLNIYKQFFDRNSIGAIIKHLNIEELLNLPIPLPSEDIQDKIAVYVTETIRKAKTLQEEANNGLEKAKQEVEKILLGE